MGLVSELEGWITGSTERDKKRVANAEAAHRASMNRAATAYSQYRPELHQAKMNALANRMAMYQPVNNIMAMMYGQQFAPSYDRALESPMSPSMLQQGSRSIRPNLRQRTPEEVMDIFGPNAPLSAYMGASANQPDEYAYGSLAPMETAAQQRAREAEEARKAAAANPQPGPPPAWPGSSYPTAGGPASSYFSDPKKKGK